MKGDSVQVYFVGGGVHVSIHVCVRELHMCMEARGQPQLSVLGAMYFIYLFFLRQSFIGLELTR